MSFKFDIETIQVNAESRELKARWTVDHLPYSNFKWIMLGTKKIRHMGKHGPTQWNVYEVVEEVIDWLLLQSSDNFKRVEIPGTIPNNCQQYAISPEIETWLKLKFN